MFFFFLIFIFGKRSLEKDGIEGETPVCKFSYFHFFFNWQHKKIKEKKNNIFIFFDRTGLLSRVARYCSPKFKFIFLGGKFLLKLNTLMGD